MDMPEEESAAGAPAWMATFADLMSLLMCFFVLLLSFSEMDVQKYKQVAGSMKNAFGVQNMIKAKDIPKGTSVIAREFSPGRPQPTQMKTINQFTTEPTKSSLSVGNPTSPKIDTNKMNAEQTARLLEQKLKSLVASTAADAEKLKGVLAKEIAEGKVDIESQGRSITIRIRERGSFPSGSATLNPEFAPVMKSMGKALRDIGGKIAVEGHTDDVPISSERFQSNWDLSATRALSVVHHLLQDKELDEKRFMVIGRADTDPLVPNDSRENRARNRRVEIVIRQGLDAATTQSLRDIKKINPSALNAIDLNVDDLSASAGSP